ncbi:MAG: hypothetical protein SOT91_04135 [Bacilli bacterium]|nr:hypothetical protein [Bacilli bacterium]
MELWIRSQDKKNLVKIRQISLNYQNNKQIIANYTPELYENSGGYYELLGTYKTKERALEILDEIQNKINLINLGHDFGSPMIDLKNPTYIYQMPEN